MLGSQEAEWGSEVGGRERGEVESEEPGSCVHCLPGRAGDTGGSRVEPLRGGR